MKKNILVLAGGLYQLPLIKTLKKKGFGVVLFDGNSSAIGFDYVDRGVVIDIGDATDCALSAKKLSDLVGVSSIVNEASVLTVAYIAEELGLFGIGVDAAKKCTDKVLMRECFYKFGLKVPLFGRANDFSQAEKLVDDIGFPVVVKPVDSSGSRGVSKVDYPYDLSVAYGSAVNHSKSGGVIVEGFLDGVEYTVEAYSVDGVAHILGFSQKKRVPFPACVSIELVYMPFELNPHGRVVVDAALKAINAVGLKDGPSHIEIIVTADGPYVVEIAARGGGFRIFPEIIQAVSGVNPIDLLVSQLSGAKPLIRRSKNDAAVLRFFSPPRSGSIVNIDGVEKARQVENIVDVVIESNTIGSYFDGIKKDGDRPGYLLSIAGTVEQALRSADESEKCVDFIIE